MYRVTEDNPVHQDRLAHHQRHLNLIEISMNQLSVPSHLVVVHFAQVVVHPDQKVKRANGVNEVRLSQRVDETQSG